MFKGTYVKYCAKCLFCVKAEWCKNEGFKYSLLDVYCCVEGGKKGITPMCPEGISWGHVLGTVQTFNQKGFGEPYIIEPMGDNNGAERTL